MPLSSVRYASNWNRRACPDEQGHWRTLSPIRLLTVIRLTILPFLHAVWTGIAGPVQPGLEGREERAHGDESRGNWLLSERE